MIVLDTATWIWRASDPADRIIVATALENAVPIVTPDERLRSYPHVQSAW